MLMLMLVKLFQAEGPVKQAWWDGGAGLGAVLGGVVVRGRQAGNSLVSRFL